MNLDMENTDENLFTFLPSWSAVGRTFNIYWNKWLLFTQLALTAIVPQIALTILLKTTTSMNEHIFSDFHPQSMLFLFIELISFCVFNTIMQAGMVQVVAECYARKTSSLKGSLRIIADRFRQILIFAATSILVYSFLLVTVAATVAMFIFVDLYWLTLLILPILVTVLSNAIKNILILLFMLPIMIAEKREGRDWPAFIAHFGCYFCCSMLLLFVPLLFGNWIYRGLVDEMSGPSVSKIVLKGLTGVLFLPLRTILVTVLYFSARVHEGDLTLEALTKELERDVNAAEPNEQVQSRDGDCELGTVNMKTEEADVVLK